MSQFEDIPVKDPVASLQFINIYKDLFFQAFTLVNAGTNGVISGLPLVGGSTGGVTGTVPNIVTGVKPHSPYRAGGFSDVTQDAQGTASLTTIYEGSSPTKQFSLISFWWGVVVATQESVASVPQNAQLTVTGYDANDNSVSQTFDYDLSSAIQQMRFAQLKAGFTNLKYAKFALETLASGDAAATLLDDIKTTVTQ